MIGWMQLQAIEHYFDLLEKTLKDNGLLPASNLETGMALETLCIKYETSTNKAQTMVVA